jgi:hypothetical protein
MDMKTPRVTLHLAAVTTYKSGHLGMHQVFLGSQMTALMAMSRAIRRGLQLLVLIGC